MHNILEMLMFLDHDGAGDGKGLEIRPSPRPTFHPPADIAATRAASGSPNGKAPIAEASTTLTAVTGRLWITRAA